MLVAGLRQAWVPPANYGCPGSGSELGVRGLGLLLDVGTLRPKPMENPTALEAMALDPFVQPRTCVCRGFVVDLNGFRGHKALKGLPLRSQMGCPRDPSHLVRNPVEEVDTPRGTASLPPRMGTIKLPFQLSDASLCLGYPCSCLLLLLLVLQRWSGRGRHVSLLTPRHLHRGARGPIGMILGSAMILVNGIKLGSVYYSIAIGIELTKLYQTSP